MNMAIPAPQMRVGTFISSWTGTKSTSQELPQQALTKTTLKAGSYDAFLVKFNSSGVRQWGTYYGGTGYDEGASCATDMSGNVYLAGYTQSTTGIATTGAHQTTYGGSSDAFLVKFDACPAVYSQDTITACDSYTWIDGVTYTLSDTTAKDTLLNAAGCDSIVSLFLTINNSTSAIDT